MQEKHKENNDNEEGIWENNPIEIYINNSLIPEDGRELMEFEKTIWDSIAVEVDKNTGKVQTNFSWNKIGRAIMEVTAVYAKEKRVPHINPIKSIKAGMDARRRTRILEKFYLEYIQSGKYQARLVEVCEKIEDPDKVNDSVVIYLKSVISKLKNELEGRKG